jgi:hypothetical protein
MHRIFLDRNYVSVSIRAPSTVLSLDTIFNQFHSPSLIRHDPETVSPTILLLDKILKQSTILSSETIFNH